MVIFSIMVNTIILKNAIPSYNNQIVIRVIFTVFDTDLIYSLLWQE